MSELKGSELGSTKVRVESGPVRVFAKAVTDASTQYAAEDAVVPPTFPFSWSYWGTIEGSTKGLPIDKLRGAGRMILHGEQEFVYHRQPVVGDVLTSNGSVKDVYEKTSSSGKTMTFIITETQWRDAQDRLVATSTMTLLHRA